MFGYTGPLSAASAFAVSAFAVSAFAVSAFSTSFFSSAARLARNSAACERPSVVVGAVVGARTGTDGSGSIIAPTSLRAESTRCSERCSSAVRARRIGVAAASAAMSASTGALGAAPSPATSTTASASISTRLSSPTRPACTRVLAGALTPAKRRPCTRATGSQSRMRRTKIRVRTTSDKDAPSALRDASTMSSAKVACAAGSWPPATRPLRRVAVVPETCTTRRPPVPAPPPSTRTARL